MPCVGNAVYTVGQTKTYMFSGYDETNETNETLNTATDDPDIYNGS